MAKNLNISLSFTADSSKVRAELNSLKKSLNELSSSAALKTPSFEFTKDLQEASRAAAQLKVQLDAAVNTKTGNLDLTKFSESMKKSGMSLEKYQNQLYQLGPAGEKAFADLAKAITMADVPLRRSSKLLDELWTTMKNTARWQLTSSAMHGFMGAVSSAYGYAKDLNASLNDIRIVTGASTEKMAEFAKEANNAAKALSTTTTDYTKASLIFYQQGLDDAQVKERTDITIKMANAAGASAEKVSDQLTAVWNNFYDGTKSLEYYADVMTALGAATASSTDEIAGGLEKFAAIGKTIGLSYEYAASALATITSNTRQSEEVVGTALKTIFARIQGLNLGETLDDGVTLNKYSQALEKVGISIFDSTGELKNMDNILDEMAAKWDVLNNSQQVALAQTVAGVRQYNQLIALMDNWDSGDSDSMVANLTTATNSTGTLQNQADIYAESWEAANKRVKASAEAVYSAILNDEFFIDLSNGFADLIDGVKIFIDSLGGVKGVLLAIGSIVTNVFSKQIGQGIQNAIFSLKGFFNPQAILDAEVEQKKKVNKLLIEGFKDKGTTSGGQSAEVYAQIGAQQISYIQNAERMSEVEKIVNQQLMDRNQLLADEAIKAGQILEKTEERIAEERQSLVIAAKIAAAKNPGGVKAANDIPDLQKKVESLTKSYSVLKAVGGKLEIAKNLPKNSQEFVTLKTNVDNVVKSLIGLNPEDTISDFNALGKALNMSAKDAETFYNTLKNADSVTSLQTVIAEMAEAAGTGSATAIDKLRTALINCTGDTKKADEMMENYLATIKEFGPHSIEAKEALNKLITGVSGLTDEMDKTKEKPMELSQAFSKAASAVMAMGQAYTTITGIIDVFNDSEATTKDKIMAVVSGIGMLIPAIMSIGSAFSTASVEVSIFGATTTVAMWKITAIVVAITALAIGIALLINHLNVYGQTLEQANKKLEQTSKDAENAANAVEEAKNAYQDLTDTIEDYQGAEDALGTLIEGTEEFKNQLKEANEYARKLMDTYGVKGTYNAEKGLWEISDEALEAGMSEYNKKLEQAYIENAVAQNALSAAKNHQAFAKLVAEDDKTQGEHTLENTNNQYYNDAASAADSPAAAAGLTLGNLISSWIKSFEDVEQQEEQNKRQIGVLDEVLKYWDSYNGDLNKISQELNLEGIDSKSDLLSALGMTESALQDLMNSLSSNTEAILENNKFIIDNTWKNNEVYSESEHKDAINNLAAAEMMTESERILNQYDKYNDKQMEDLQKSYAKKKGLTFVSEEDGVAEFLDTEGKTVKFSNDSIKAFMAQEQALENVGVSLESFAENLNKLAQKSNEGDLAGALAYSQASGGDISDVAVGYADSDVQTFDSVESLQKYLNIDDKAFEALWKSKGFMSAEAYLESFNTQVSSFKDQVGKLDIAKDLSIFNELSLGVAQSIESSADKMNLGPLGQSAGEQYIAGLNSMLSGIKEEDQVAAMERLSSIDWSSWDAMQQAQVILSDFGKEIDTTDPYWKTFIDNMRVANGSFPDFTKLQTNLQEISAILGSLDFGDVIKDEDYEKLVAYNQEWEKFFILQANGTRKFIGDSTEMLNATRENIIAQREDLATRKGLIEQVTDSKADWKISAMSIEQQYGGKDGKLSDWNGINHGYKSGEDMINNIMADQTRDLIDNNAAIKEILNNNDYDETVINDILREARDGNRERLETMLTYVDDYMTQDLEASEAQLNEMMASTATNFADLNALYEQGSISAEAWGKQAEVLKQDMLAGASTLEEFRTAMSQLEQNDVDVSQSEKANALMELANNYDNCTKEIEEYKIALARADEAQIAAAEDSLNAAILIGEAANKYDLDPEVLETQAKQIRKLNPELKLSAEQAARLAVNNQRMNKGIEALNKNFSSWKKTLKTADKASMDYAEALTEVEDAIGDLIGAAEDFTLPDGFIDMPGVMELIEEAATGDELAINQLGNKISAASVDAMTMNESLVNMYNEAFGANITTDTFDEAKQTVLNGINEIYNNLNGLLDGSTNITDVVGNDWVTALNEMALATGMSVDQMNGLLSQLGVQAEVKTVNVPQEVEVPTYDETYVSAGKKTFTYTEIGEDGEQTTHSIERPVMRKISVPGPLVKTQGYVQVASIGTVEGGGADTPQLSFTGVGGTGNNSRGGNIGGGVSPSSSGSGGGGGGGSTKKTSESRKKRSDMGERYKEITDKIEDQTRAAEKASRAMDRLYGTGRIRAMRQLSKELEKEVELLKQKREEAENYLKEDARELESAAGALGYTIRYDQGENISNYTAIMDQLYKDREKLLDSFGNEIDETEQEALDALDESIERFENAVSTYDETKGILKDLVDEIDSKVDEQMSLAADELSYRLELRLEIDDRALTRIEYLLSRMEDDFFQMGEQAALLAGEKYSATVSKLQNYQTSKDEWDAKLAAREVTPERYAEAMQEIYDGIYTELGALEEIDNAMKHYYEDTVAAAGEEIAKYTDRMSRAAGVLEHYKSVLTLIGKSTDYKKMGAILDGQTQTIKNSMAAAKTIADMYYEQAKEKELLYKQALAEGNEEVAARYKLEWEAALGAAEEASDEYQGLVEQWAENVNAILENTLAGLKQDLEKTITGGSSFDDMLTAMDRAESLQEEYLTTTNKIYETNKLMRKAQQDIDKSTNSIAKKRLKQFITETQELQNQTKLSNYELEIQQAKYNLLLAEIAVEEARNAKSTVRLQRDNEGNFGYVYTADTSAVDAAVQQYEDAQNRLYNLSLEGANEYSRKYLQTLQEMSDAFSEIEQKRMEGHYATNEEYQQAMDAAKKYYYEKLENYSYLYSVALGTDANVAQEAWSTEFGTMTTKTEEWKTAVNSYVKDAGQAFKDWKTEMDAVESAAGIEGDLDTLKTKVGEVTTESGLLLDELTGEDGLLAAIKQEFIDVSNATTAWDTQYTTLKNVRNEYDLLGQSIKNTLDEMSKVPDEDDVPNDEIDSNDGKDKPDDTTPDQELKIESQESVPTTPSYLTGNLTWKGNGASRVWTDSAGNTYKWNSEVGKAIQAAFNTAVGRNGGYTGDFFLGWNTLSADELQKYGLKDVTTAAFDTGGYTGSWGPYGKLAILHEKELILKPQDTENFLASMDLLNKIVSTIDLYTINAQLGGALNSPYLGMLNNTDTLEQSVHIEANFPSVTNHLEIEEALSNLVNTASQFANRK